MKLEPAGYIGADAFEAISGGGTICQTMTPKWVAPGDVALYAIPEGYKLVPVEGAQTAYVCVGCEAIYWDDNVSCDCQVPGLDKFRKVEVIEGEQ